MLLGNLCSLGNLRLCDLDLLSRTRADPWTLYLLLLSDLGLGLDLLSQPSADP